MRMHALELPSCGATVHRLDMVSRMGTMLGHAAKIGKPVSVKWTVAPRVKGGNTLDRFDALVHIVGTDGVDILWADMNREELDTLISLVGNNGTVESVESLPTDTTIQQLQVA